MQSKILNFSFALLIGILCHADLTSQQESDEKEIIIIEKVQDTEGNIISKKTKRYNGKYTEDQIQKFIDEIDPPSMGSFDLEGLGFGDNYQDFFNTQPGRPTIGVNLDFKDGQASVVKVNLGTGAEESDLRVGDKIISINGVAISTIEDIYEILDKKKVGDIVQVVIFRDGQEIEKNIKLGKRGIQNFFFELPEEGRMQLFGDNLAFDLDSLFKDLREQSELWKGLDDTEFQQLKGYENIDETDNSERPSLGVFLDDTKTEVVVTEVVPDSPADKAGLIIGDVILRMDNNLITSFREVKSLMNIKKKGDILAIDVRRNNKKIKVQAKLD